MPTVDPTSNSAAAFYDPSSALPVPTKTLTQADFLKLLVAQMSSQDPLNPQSNTDFAAQMAQFTALATSQTTESDMSKLRANEQITQANSLIGRAVTLQDTSTTTASGTVTGVQIVNGAPQLVVNGQPYDLSQVLSIQQPAPATTP